PLARASAARPRPRRPHRHRTASLLGPHCLSPYLRKENVMTVACADQPEPEGLYEWTARGFTVGEARRWIGWGCQVAEAERWRDGGVAAPDDALAWGTAGRAPCTGGSRLRAGMTPGGAVRGHGLGQAPAEAAERHLAGERPGPRRLRDLFRSRSRRASVLGDEE